MDGGVEEGVFGKVKVDGLVRTQVEVSGGRVVLVSGEYTSSRIV